MAKIEGVDLYISTKKREQNKTGEVAYHVVYETKHRKGTITLYLDKKIRTHDDVVKLREYLERNETRESTLIFNWIELEG